ncbi:MAG: rod shape-determining protein MreD [bacterium]|nr:rod shape-determining protein MreD [bacterium]
MSRWALSGIAFALVVLDVSLGGLLTMGTARPSLTLPFVVYIGLSRSPIEAVVFGFAVGLCQDLFGSLTLGATALAYSVIGFACAKLWSESWIRLWWPWGVSLIVAGLADQAFAHYLLARGSGYSFFPVFLTAGLPSAAYTALLGLMWYLSPLHRVRAS